MPCLPGQLRNFWKAVVLSCIMLSHNPKPPRLLPLVRTLWVKMELFEAAWEKVGT